jgi:2-polyprenyl-3-methyl-5-hydroxy-6-metoxy-1,4-benzoquinol methylase
MTTRDSHGTGDHFAFGENWLSFGRLIDPAKIISAKEGLARLVPDIAGKNVLDIGCGSGLHALAAVGLNAAHVLAVDLDSKSVEAARKTLTQFASGQRWTVETADALLLDPTVWGTFDIVYSWGVLHHTGNLDLAMTKASQLVKPGGLIVLALYRRTMLDRFWVTEKRWYSSASPGGQKFVRGLYHAAFQVASTLTGKGRFAGTRGMDYWHDVHDWLGGYPYEAVLAPEVDTKLTALGFVAERVFARSRGVGIFGSGCDEYVYRKLGPV